MSILQTLLSKNNKTVKYSLALFFLVALLGEMIHRYHYRAELEYKLSWAEMELMVLIALIFINPKGIKIIGIGVFVLLISMSTKSVIFEVHSRVPSTLLLRDILHFLKIDKSIVYLMHLVIYLLFIYFMLEPKNKSRREIDLIDQV